eukprot:SAG22_NODE_1406_length_4490_cov_5.574357_5_plen_190_part_00
MVVSLQVALDGNLPTETGPADPFPHGQITLDNLIHRQEIPVTIAVFISPGVAPPATGFTHQRTVEYSTLSGRFAGFLEQDIVRTVLERRHRLRISADPRMRLVAGKLQPVQTACSSCLPPLQWHVLALQSDRSFTLPTTCLGVASYEQVAAKVGSARSVRAGSGQMPSGKSCRGSGRTRTFAEVRPTPG